MSAALFDFGWTHAYIYDPAPWRDSKVQEPPRIEWRSDEAPALSEADTAQVAP